MERGSKMAFCINCGNKLDDDFEFCPECGTKVNATMNGNIFSESNFEKYTGKMKICKKCGSEMPEDSFYCLSCGSTFKESEDEFETIKRRVNMQTGTWKNKWISLLLCIFFGWLGIHRFYEGKVVTGILYLFTLGFFGLGWIIDIVRIALKPNPYRAK